jgi:hypothetical protein
MTAPEILQKDVLVARVGIDASKTNILAPAIGELPLAAIFSVERWHTQNESVVSDQYWHMPNQRPKNPTTDPIDALPKINAKVASGRLLVTSALRGPSFEPGKPVIEYASCSSQYPYDKTDRLTVRRVLFHLDTFEPIGKGTYPIAHSAITSAELIASQLRKDGTYFHAPSYIDARPRIGPLVLIRHPRTTLFSGRLVLGATNPTRAEI